MISSIHILPNCGFSSGGPSRSVPNLIEALNNTGVTKNILLTAVSSDEELEHFSRSPNITPKLVNNFYSLISFYFVIFCYIKKEVNSVVHIHSLFNLTTTFSILLCMFLSRPFVIQPRGMLEPWSLKQSYKKKKLFIAMVGKAFFKNAKAVICTSDQEMQNVKLLFPKSNYFVVPNIVKLNQNPDECLQSGFELHSKLPKTYVFFSRLHPKKNIEFLIEIFSDPNMSECKLHVYGYIDGKYAEDLVSRFSLHDNITYCGVLENSNLHKIQKYQALLFPSFSENFGMVILEALSFNLPVVLNRDLPWSTFEHEEAVCCLNLVRSDWVKKISGGFPDEITHTDIKLSSKRVCDYFAADKISETLMDVYLEP